MLTLLALYHHGYGVGKYISLERIIEQSRETYYDVLQKSSNGWHGAKHDISPWLNYFLEVVIQAINSQIGEFSISDIEKLCPGVSQDMIRVVSRQLQRDKKIVCLGKGQSAKWERIG